MRVQAAHRNDLFNRELVPSRKGVAKSALRVKRREKIGSGPQICHIIWVSLYNESIYTLQLLLYTNHIRRSLIPRAVLISDGRFGVLYLSIFRSLTLDLYRYIRYILRTISFGYIFRRFTTGSPIDGTHWLPNIGAIAVLAPAARGTHPRCRASGVLRLRR